MVRDLTTHPDSIVRRYAWKAVVAAAHGDHAEVDRCEGIVQRRLWTLSLL